MKARAVWAALGAAAICGACTAGAQKLTGIGEPMVVQGGQFFEGPLPGTPPPDGGATEDDGGIPPLSIANLGFSSQFVPAGEQSKSLSGDVAEGAIAVGLQLEGMGTGYWVVPAGIADNVYPGYLTFSYKANFAQDIPPGFHDVLSVGLSPSGQAGMQTPLSLCFFSLIPDNGHSCFPKQPLPDTVYSLTWDTNFDVDLHVVLPNGVDISPKSPAAEPPDAAASGIPEDDPHIDRDSLRSCVADGYRREDVVFQNRPPPGAYLIYADPFAPCAQSATRFTFTVYHPSGQCPNCTMVPDPNHTKSGELLAVQATGGMSTGLFVEQINN